MKRYSSRPPKGSQDSWTQCANVHLMTFPLKGRNGEKLEAVLSVQGEICLPEYLHLNSTAMEDSSDVWITRILALCLETMHQTQLPHPEHPG